MLNLNPLLLKNLIPSNQDILLKKLKMPSLNPLQKQKLMQ